MEINKNEELKFIISRYDHYYDSVNNKGNFYLTINTFILGGLITWFHTVDDSSLYSKETLFFALTLGSNLISFIFTLLAIKPYLKSVNDKEDGSIIFFGDVANYHFSEFELRWNNMTSDMIYTDLKKQSMVLAKGLKHKFKLLLHATWFIAIEIVLVIVLCITISTL